MLQFLVGQLTGISKSEPKGDQTGDIAVPAPDQVSSRVQFSDLIDQQSASDDPLQEPDPTTQETPDASAIANQAELSSPEVIDAIAPVEADIPVLALSDVSPADPEDTDTDDTASPDRSVDLIMPQVLRNSAPERVTPTFQNMTIARTAPSNVDLETISELAGTSAQASKFGQEDQDVASYHLTAAPRSVATPDNTAQGKTAQWKTDVPATPHSDIREQLETASPRMPGAEVFKETPVAKHLDPGRQPVQNPQTGSSPDIVARIVTPPGIGDAPLSLRNQTTTSDSRPGFSGLNGTIFAKASDPDHSPPARDRDLADPRADPVPLRTETQRLSAMPKPPISAVPFPAVIGNMPNLTELRDFDSLETYDTRVLLDTTSPLRRATGFSFSRVDLPHHVTAQVTDSILRTNTQQIELQLDPVELGRVKINLQTQDGSVVVHITADRGETLDLLRRHMDILAQDLRDIGYKTSQFAFSDGRSGKPNQNQVKASQSGVHVDTPDPGDLSSSAQNTQRVLRLNNRIDIRL